MSSPGQQLVTLFERLGEQIGQRYALNFAPRAPAPSPAPARAPKPKPKPKRRAAPKLARTPSEKIPKLSRAERVGVGRKVWYRQGRGAFEAEVIRVNEDAGTVVLQRIADLQRVVRPRDKVLRPR